MSIKSKISIIIPSKNETFLNKTIEDLLNKAQGDIEVIAVLDGWWPEDVKRQFWSTPQIINDPRVIYVHKGVSQGMRAAINTASALAKGEYLMKIDAHCMFDEGFDEKLKSNCDKHWVVIPSRYSLNPEKWEIDSGRPRRDYHYLCYPAPDKGHDMGMHGVEWLERGKIRSDPKYDIDENMSFQGSCWFMHKKWFTDFLEGMSEDPIYAGWAQEPTEIGNKTWLGGGKVVVNKKTWYAHLHKGRTYRRTYKTDEKGIIEGHNFAAKYWMNNMWEKRLHNIDWLVEKFWPVPTWPEDRKLWVSPI